MQNIHATATGTWDTVVEIENVTKYFDQVRPISLLKRKTVRVMALQNVSFALRRGEFVAYAGPNGAGKSTTFKLLCGMLIPQSGAVRAFSSDPAKKRIETMKKTGVLFGNRSELWWDHPVKASFLWKKAVWSIPDDVYNTMLGRVRELLELDEIMDVFARELSLGQRMRANLAMVMLNDPQLILLDEPTLGLDVLAKRQMIEFLKRLNREQGTTILVTSHDMDDLTEMANRLLLINRGAIAFDGGHAELLKMTGDLRRIKLTIDGPAPDIDGARLIEDEGGGYLYEYDGAAVPVSLLMQRLGQIPGVQDVETMRAPIESVIADLYKGWAQRT